MRQPWLLLFTEWHFIGLINFCKKNDDIESWADTTCLYFLKNEELKYYNAIKVFTKLRAKNKVIISYIHFNTKVFCKYNRCF